MTEKQRSKKGTLMQILDFQKINFQPTDIRLGPSKVKTIAVFLMSIGLLSIPLILTYNNHLWIPFYFVMFFSAAVLLVLGHWLIKAFKKEGWRILVQNSGILLKVDINGKNNEDIIEIRFSEIISLRKIQERYFCYQGGRNRFKPVRFDSLDFQLTSDAYTTLAERTGSESSGYELLEPNRLIYVTGREMLKTNAVIEHLKAYCSIQESQRIYHDIPNLKNKRQVKSYAQFLARRNHKFDSHQLVEDVLK